MRAENGFTLVELLIYTGIFAVVGVVLTSIFVIFLRIDIRETAGAEISNQANFILQRIQNYINNAGFLVVNDGGDDEQDDTLATPRAKLIIKDRGERSNPTPANDALSPIIIYKDGNFIKVQQGLGTLMATENLNNDKVKVTNLTFTKVSNPPGRDSVIINLTLEYNNPSLPQQISRTFALGVGKAAAAVFDTSLNPGGTTLDIGVGTKWRDLFLSGKIVLDNAGTSNVNSIQLGPNQSGQSNVLNKFFHGAIIGINIPATAADTNRTLTDVSLPNTTANLGDRVFLAPTALPTGIVLVSAIAKSNGLIDIIVRNTAPAASTAGAGDFHFLLIK